MPTHKHLPKKPPDVCAQVRLEDGRRVDLPHDTRPHDPRGPRCIHCGQQVAA